MKMRILVVIFLLFLVPLQAQNLGSLNYINELGDREAATYGDAVKFFMMIQNRDQGSFQENLAALSKSGITKGIRSGETSLLDRGTLSLMAARYLDLKDSLFYLITGSGRYAFRACIEEGLMDAEAGEWDVVSGEELIETMARVAEKKEASK